MGPDQDLGWLSPSGSGAHYDNEQSWPFDNTFDTDTNFDSFVNHD